MAGKDFLQTALALGFVMILLSILTVGCRQVTDTQTATSGGLQLTVKQSGFVDSTAASTRATEAKFQNGDTVGVFIHTTATVAASSNHSPNMKYITDDAGASWRTASRISEAMVVGGTYYSTAYYPYKQLVTNATSITHSVKSDQSATAGDKATNLEASDFMISSPSPIVVTSPSSGNATLSFKHVLTKLIVSVGVPASIEGIEVDRVTNVAIFGLNITSSINLATGVVTPTPTTVRAIKPRLLSGTGAAGTVSSWEAIVIPQSVPANTEMVVFTCAMKSGGDKKLTYTTPAAAPLVLASGNKILLTLSSSADLAFTSTFALDNGDARTGMALGVKAASGASWTLSSNADWLTVCKTAGGTYGASITGTGTSTSEDVYVAVAANKNALAAPRMAILKLSNNIGGTMEYCVMQNYTNFAPSVVALRFGNIGGQAAALTAFQTNTVWTIDVANVSADPINLSISTTAGGAPLALPYEMIGSLAENSLFVQVATANSTYFERTGKVILEIKGSSPRQFVEIPVTQAAAIDPTVPVTIAGIRWMPTNLTGDASSDAGHKLEAAPQNYGMFFKWGATYVYKRETDANEGEGFADGQYTRGAATNPTGSQTGGLGYDYSYIFGGSSYVGDPCAKLNSGSLRYRTPTRAQLVALNNTGSLWSTYNGVPGCFFGPSASSCNNTTIQPGCIFLPASGWRNYDSGSLQYEGSIGWYWSSTVFDANQGYGYYFDLNGTINPDNYGVRSFGLSVRCVDVVPAKIEVVEIAGTKWLTTNLTGDAGTNTNHAVEAAPQDLGMFFKWGAAFVYGRINSTDEGEGFAEGQYTRGAATNPTSSQTVGLGYDYSYISGGSSYVGDPCAKLNSGALKYKTPTRAQWVALKNAGVSGWTTYQGTQGYFWGPSASSCNNTTIQPGCIFLPASGWRNYGSGSLDYKGSIGWYWSSTVFDANQGYYCYFDLDGTINPESYGVRSTGFSVRCVAE